eukprot:g2308.t1
MVWGCPVVSSCVCIVFLGVERVSESNGEDERTPTQCLKKLDVSVCVVVMTVLAVPDLPTTAPVSAAKDTSLPTDVDTRRPASRSDRPEKKARKAGEAGAEEGTPRPFQPMGRMLGVEEVSWLDKDQEQSVGWDTSMLDGVQYLRVSFRNQVTGKLRKVYETLEAVLAWNEHDPVEHAQWVRTINEEVVAKRGSWKCLGDGSALPAAVVTPGLAGVAAFASKVQQRFKHLQRYACAAFALFNVLDAPRQYNKKMRTFKKSIKSLAVFFEFVDWLQNPDLVVCRQPVVARSLNKLLEPTQGLALVTKGTHCFGIDFGRRLLFDGRSDHAHVLCEPTLLHHGFKQGATARK